MKFSQETYQDYIQILKDLAGQDWVQHYFKLKAQPNFWSVIEYGKTAEAGERSAHETRLSKMLRWLIDPAENHGLGSLFAEKLLGHLGLTYRVSPIDYDQVMALNEYKHIDLLYLDKLEKVCLALEMKQYAKEGKRKGKSQLLDYEAVVEEFEQRKAYTPFYVYLAPLKEKPSREKWQALTYGELIQILESLLESIHATPELPYRNHTLKLVEDFKDELQRSIYHEQKIHLSPRDLMTLEQRKLTVLLVEELEGKREVDHIATLRDLSDEEDFPLEEMIFLVREAVQTQNHASNDEVKILIRKLYNFLSQDKQLNIDLSQKYSAKETKASIKEDLFAADSMAFVQMELTSRGQGLKIYREDGRYFIYMSGNREGYFPSAGVHIRRYPVDKFRDDATKVKTGQFHLKDYSILDDELYDAEGTVHSLEEVIQQYIIPAIQELNDLYGRVD